MKKIILFAFLGCVCWLSALDNICLKDGNEISGKVVEITSSEIKYRKASNLQGPLYSQPKSSVLFIKYENGEKEIIAPSENQTTEATPSQTKHSVLAPVHNTQKEEKQKSRNFTIFLAAGSSTARYNDYDEMDDYVDPVSSVSLGFNYSKYKLSFLGLKTGLFLTKRGYKLKGRIESSSGDKYADFDGSWHRPKKCV